MSSFLHLEQAIVVKGEEFDRLYELTQLLLQLLSLLPPRFPLHPSLILKL
jgi:hypothetical protein